MEDVVGQVGESGRFLYSCGNLASLVELTKLMYTDVG